MLDDSGRGTGAELAAVHPGVELFTTAGGGGLYGDLYLNLGSCFAHVVQHYQFESLLRIDTDALVIGPNPEQDAMTLFDDDPLVGSAGNYLYEFGGSRRDPSWVASKIRRHTRQPRSVIRHPKQFLAMWRVLSPALRNGYYLGEEVFGGACFYSYPALKTLHGHGYLPRGSLSTTSLQEDEIFGLSLRAFGYHFADLWEFNRSFGCTWGTLPASPQELLDGGAKVIHSVRDYEGLSEAETRAFFRHLREGD